MFFFRKTKGDTFSSIDGDTDLLSGQQDNLTYTFSNEVIQSANKKEAEFRNIYKSQRKSITPMSGFALVKDAEHICSIGENEYENQRRRHRTFIALWDSRRDAQIKIYQIRLAKVEESLLQVERCIQEEEERSMTGGETDETKI